MYLGCWADSTNSTQYLPRIFLGRKSRVATRNEETEFHLLSLFAAKAKVPLHVTPSMSRKKARLALVGQPNCGLECQWDALKSLFPGFYIQSYSS